MDGRPENLGPTEKLAILTRAAGLLAAAPAFHDTLGQVVAACLPALGDFGFFDLRVGPDEVVRTARAHEAPALEALLRPTGWVRQERTDLNLCALSTGQPALHTGIDDAWYQRIAVAPAQLDLLRALAFRSMLTVPMWRGDELVGALTLFFGASGRQHGPAHLAFAQELAALVVPTVINARLGEVHRRTEEELRAAHRAKDEFLAMLGHELRNPLAPIASALALMRQRGEPGAAAERAIIERQVAHLARLVDDLLDVARIARGDVEITRARVDLRTIVTHAAEMARPLYAQREVGLELALGDAPACVDGDAVRLAQVVGNLLTNAAKFSPPGERVTVELAAAPAGHVLRVRDRGDGIHPTLLPRVFDLFVQGPQGLDRAQGGLGLGLAIVANLVARHGGRVAAHSDGPGRGACFTVELPAVPDDRPAPQREPRSPAPATGRILLVDDNVDAAHLLGAVLAEEGFEVAVETAPAAALARAAAFGPQLAILDIGLPGMNGYELARRLRALPALAGVPLVALSGYAPRAEAAHAPRFDRHLVKPVDPEQLLAVLGELLGPASRAVTA